jgi:hypothetical protein
MKIHILKLGLLLVIISLFPQTVKAASGMPNSSQFGYGVHVDIWGKSPEAAVQLAGNLNIEWVAIDLDWQRLQPEFTNSPQWDLLDPVLSSASEHHVSVLISISHAPSWAISENGPDPQLTANLVSALASRYSNTLLALELFPSANTSQGWGSTPDPQAYTELLIASNLAIQSINPEIVFVAAGLQPVLSSPNDIEDIAFLNELYASNAVDFMPIVGLRLPPLSNDPLTPNFQANGLVLRHYENIRNTMIENGHKSGLIWITGFSWDPNILPSTSDQAAWMKQAYLLLRSQLYIGTAFFDGLNPSLNSSTSLLFQDGSYHPGFDELVQLIALDHDRQMIKISTGLIKKITNKTTQK